MLMQLFCDFFTIAFVIVAWEGFKILALPFIEKHTSSYFNRKKENPIVVANANVNLPSSLSKEEMAVRRRFVHTYKGIDLQAPSKGSRYRTLGDIDQTLKKKSEKEVDENCRKYVRNLFELAEEFEGKPYLTSLDILESRGYKVIVIKFNDFDVSKAKCNKFELDLKRCLDSAYYEDNSIGVILSDPTKHFVGNCATADKSLRELASGKTIIEKIIDPSVPIEPRATENLRPSFYSNKA